MSEALLGIDLGTGSVKVIVVDAQSGDIRGSGSAEYAIRHPEPGAAEQSPDAWWEATVAATRAALSAAGEATVSAIGLSGQMHGTVTLDERGTPTGPAVIWADTRSAPDAAAIRGDIGPERLLEIAGSPIATGFEAATIHWLRREQPDRWQRSAMVLLPKDYLRYRLTGAFATEPSDAASTLLVDRTTRDWSPSLMNAAGVDRNQLPRIVPSAAVTGGLTPAAARAMGLRAGIPVVGGAGDAPAAALGAGITDPAALLLTLSTGAQALMPIDQPRYDRLGRLHTFCSVFEPGGPAAAWYVMGATMVAGLAMRWLRDDIFALQGAQTYDAMTGWAGSAPIGSGGLLFLPYLTGERTPHLNPNARGAFIGIGAEHGRAHLTRAVMEGVSLALFDAYAVVHEVTGVTPERIVLAGGGARSAVWRQMIADLFGKPVRPVVAGEQSALGAAILAGPATGRADLQDPASVAGRWVRPGREVIPNESAHRRYQELVPLFRTAYRQQIGLFEQLAEWRKPEP